MATIIEALGDKIKIDKAFVSGKDRISVNDQVTFEGKLIDNEPVKFQAGSREYRVSRSVVSKMTSATATEVQVIENNEVIHSGIYDQQGKPVKDLAQAKSSGAVQACGMIGMAIGLGIMLTLGPESGIFPGGAIGGAISGAIGGGVGGAIGFGLGTAIFGRK